VRLLRQFAFYVQTFLLQIVDSHRMRDRSLFVALKTLNESL
jgi:hypothetical protein